MKAFISWSGGKDCMYALYLFLKDSGNEVAALLNMCEADSDKSRSHGLSKCMIVAQAQALALPLVQQPIIGDYESSFKEAVLRLKAEGVTAGVFGDIYLDAHKVWIERVCSEIGIMPVFPLWQMDTLGLMRRFIQDGFRTMIVAIRTEKAPKSLLGRVLDMDLLSEISALPGVDPSGENGEYHTFVFDGPLFNHSVSFTSSGRREDSKHCFAELVKETGLIHIYTGDGKGKTTAAVGLATRALGSGFNVLYCSFHKRPEKYGYTEMDSLKKLGATVLNFAKGHPHLDRSIDEGKIVREIAEALPMLSERIAKDAPDLLIMDEILISVRDHYMDESVLVDFIRNKPIHTELVLTGRGATPSLIALADYVSEIRKVKHPYDRNVYSRNGIEF